jgi:hypothetical protein
MADLVTRYSDLPLGTTDAAVIAVAERLGVAEVATLDWRHFTVVRPRHRSSLVLLPENCTPASWTELAVWPATPPTGCTRPATPPAPAACASSAPP